MEEQNIHPIGQPTMVDMDFKRGEHFQFTIKYEVKPDITLEAYKGITVERPVHAVTDAEVEAEIQQIRRSSAEQHRAEPKRRRTPSTSSPPTCRNWTRPGRR